MSKLDVVVERLAPGVTRVGLSGELERDHAYTLDVQLRQVEAETSTLIIDLGGLTFLDSTGLGRLLAARRRAARAGRRLVVVRGSRTVDRMLMPAGLDDAVELVAEAPPAPTG